MSKIFDALKQAESNPAKYKDTTATGERPDRRRTSRTNLQVPLFVYGYTPTGEPFYEEACTIAINAQGGLISMRNVVPIGQRLAVMNKRDEYPQECVVLSVRARLEYGFDVAFEFPISMPQFWQASEIGTSTAMELPSLLCEQGPAHGERGYGALGKAPGPPTPYF